MAIMELRENVFVNNIMTSADANVGDFVFVIRLLIAFGASLYAFFNISKYGRGFPSNPKFMELAVIMILALSIGDFLVNTSFFNEYLALWDNGRIMFGIAAFYLLYRFAGIMTAKTQLGQGPAKRDYAIVLLILLVSPLAESMLQGNGQMLSVVIHILLVFGVLYAVYMLGEMVKETKQASGPFSLRSLAISMVPLLCAIIVVFVLLATLNEIMHHLGIPQNAFVMGIAAAAGLSYMALAISMAWFAYMAKQIYKFDEPIKKFVEAKKQKSGG